MQQFPDQVADMPDHVKSAVRSAYPEQYESMMQKAGKNLPEYKESAKILGEMGGGSEFGDVDALKKQVDELRAEIQKGKQADQGKLSDQLGEGFKDFGSGIVDAFLLKMKEELENIRAKIALSHNN